MSGMTIEQAWEELDAGIQALPPRLSEECEAALATLRAEIDGLREALRELVEVFSESGMYDEEVFAKARAALDQEG